MVKTYLSLNIATTLSMDVLCRLLGQNWRGPIAMRPRVFEGLKRYRSG